MKSETKIPRFTYKHGGYYSTLAVDGSTKWIRLSKDKEAALLMCESKKGGPVDSKVKEMLQLFKECKQWVKLARATKRTCAIYVYKVEYQDNMNRPQFSRHSPAALRTAPHTLPARAGY